MRPRGFSDTCYYLAKGIQLVFGVLGAALPATLKITPSNLPHSLDWLDPTVIWLQQNTGWISPCCLAVAAVATFLMKWLGEPWAWKMVSSLINGFRGQIFPNETDDPVHFRRVTLFRCKWWCWTRKYKHIRFRKPWGGWLCIATRSGHTTLKSRSAFAIGSDGKAEGVAGRSWTAHGTIYEVDLPALTPDSSEDDFAKYAEKTAMDPVDLKRRVKDGFTFPRAYCAFPVEKESGGIWGVIVVDTREATLRPKSEIKSLFLSFADCLTKLVSRI